MKQREGRDKEREMQTLPCGPTFSARRKAISPLPQQISSTLSPNFALYSTQHPITLLTIPVTQNKSDCASVIQAHDHDADDSPIPAVLDN
jgi:hypothetical protein